MGMTAKTYGPFSFMHHAWPACRGRELQSQNTRQGVGTHRHPHHDPGGMAQGHTSPPCACAATSGGRVTVVLDTTRPSMPSFSATAAMSALSASVRSGATLTSSGGGPAHAHAPPQAVSPLPYMHGRLPSVIGHGALPAVSAQHGSSPPGLCRHSCVHAQRRLPVACEPFRQLRASRGRSCAPAAPQGMASRVAFTRRTSCSSCFRPCSARSPAVGGSALSHCLSAAVALQRSAACNLFQAAWYHGMSHVQSTLPRAAATVQACPPGVLGEETLMTMKSA